MVLRSITRGEILSILRISGNPLKAFSAVKLLIKWLDFIGGRIVDK
jgi:hypothetical protein